MNVLKEAREIILEEAEGFRDSAMCGDEYRGDADTTAHIERLELVAAGLYAVMLTLGME